MSTDITRLHTELQECLDALANLWDGQEEEKVDVPDVFHDGSPITSVKELSVAMGIEEWPAAVHVLSVKDHPLHSEAKRVLHSEFEGTAALMLLPRNPEKFTVPGGTDPKELHCTLFYTGNIDLLPVKTQDEFVDHVRSLQIPIIDAEVNGHSVFYNDPENPLFVLNVDSPQLEEARGTVTDSMDVPQTHGFTPHMTVQKLRKRESPPKVPRQPQRVVFDRMRVAYDGSNVDIPLVPSQTFDDVDVETKGIRRVRTPAGAEWFDQPIGSIIVPDIPELTPTGADYHPSISVYDVQGHGIDVPEEEGWVTKVKFEKSSDPALNNRIVITQEKPPILKGADPFMRDVGRMSYHPDSGRIEGIQTHENFARRGIATGMWNLAKKLSEHHGIVAPAHSETQTEDGSAWASSVGHSAMPDAWTDPPSYASFTPVHETDRFVAGVYEETPAPSNRFIGRKTGVVRDKVMGRQHVAPFGLKIESAVEASTERNRKKIEAWAEKKLPELVGEDDPMYVHKPSKAKDRNAAANKALEDVGLSIAYAWAPNDDGDDFPPDEMDEVGSVGTYITDGLGQEHMIGDDARKSLSPAVKEAVANLARQHEDWFPGFLGTYMDRNMHASVPPNGEAWLASVMNRGPDVPQVFDLHELMWAENDAEFGAGKQPLLESQPQSHFYSANVYGIAQHHGMTPSEAFAYNTVAHEFGHVVSNSIMFQEGVDAWAEIASELINWGVFYQENGMMKMDTSVVAKHVSNYGGTNVHELMAEVWAQYVLSPQRTEFVDAVGSLLDNGFTELTEGEV